MGEEKELAKVILVNPSLSTVGYSFMVPAGIVAVTRAQERGYSVVGA